MNGSHEFWKIEAKLIGDFYGLDETLAEGLIVD
jgi:hypothetical protein